MRSLHLVRPVEQFV